jgi:glycosyltransferase involved in cell wall biosynthesis
LVAKHQRPQSSPLVARAIDALRVPVSDSIAANSQPVQLGNCFLVKPHVGQNERGVLIVSFEAQLDAIVRHPAFAEIEREYQIAFLPSWQPAYSTPLLRLAARARKPYIVMPASEHDQALGRELGPLCHTLPFQAASWVSKSQFQLAEAKDIDIVLLAIFGRYKRHWKLFEALAENPDDLRVVLAGKPWEGRTATTLREEMSAFGCSTDIEIVEAPSQEKISDLLARSRLFCAMSRKEGSFIAVVEALMSGTPVAMYRDAVIGTRRYINDQTGFLLDPAAPLGPQLRKALSVAPSLDPRSWASREISAEANVLRLNAELRRLALVSSQAWTQDIVPFHSRALHFYALDDRDEQRLISHREKLRKRYGIIFADRPPLVGNRVGLRG